MRPRRRCGGRASSVAPVGKLHPLTGEPLLTLERLRPGEPTSKPRRHGTRRVRNTIARRGTRSSARRMHAGRLPAGPPRVHQREHGRIHPATTSSCETVASRRVGSSEPMQAPEERSRVRSLQRHRTQARLLPGRRSATASPAAGRPASQQRAAHHRSDPSPPPLANPRLPRPPHQRRKDRPRSHARRQTTPLPQPLQTAHHRALDLIEASTARSDSGVMPNGPDDGDNEPEDVADGPPRRRPDSFGTSTRRRRSGTRPATPDQCLSHRTAEFQELRALAWPPAPPFAARTRLIIVRSLVRIQAELWNSAAQCGFCSRREALRRDPLSRFDQARLNRWGRRPSGQPADASRSPRPALGCRALDVLEQRRRRHRGTGPRTPARRPARRSSASHP